MTKKKKCNTVIGNILIINLNFFIMKNLKSINYVLFAFFAIATIVSLVVFCVNGGSAAADWAFIISLGLFAVEGLIIRGKSAVLTEHKDGRIVGRFVWAAIVFMAWIGMVAVMCDWLGGDEATAIGVIAMIVTIYNAINLTFFNPNELAGE